MCCNTATAPTNEWCNTYTAIYFKRVEANYHTAAADM